MLTVKSWAIRSSTSSLLSNFGFQNKSMISAHFCTVKKPL